MPLPPSLSYDFVDPVSGANNWSKADRNSKFNFLDQQFNASLGALDTEAKRIRDTEESRGGAAETLIGQALPAANAPTWTDESIRTALGQGSDAAGQDFLKGQDALRSYLGGAGVTGGGLAAGLGTNLELGRLGQVTDARRSFYLDKVRTDAADRARNFQNTLTYANAVNRPVSGAYADYLSNLSQLRLGQYGLEKGYFANKDKAKAAEDAGWMNLLGSLGGAAIGRI